MIFSLETGRSLHPSLGFTFKNSSTHSGRLLPKGNGQPIFRHVAKASGPSRRISAISCISNKTKALSFASALSDWQAVIFG